MLKRTKDKDDSDHPNSLIFWFAKLNTLKRDNVNQNQHFTLKQSISKKGITYLVFSQTYYYFITTKSAPSFARHHYF